MAGALQILFISLNLFANNALDQIRKLPAEKLPAVADKPTYVKDGSLEKLLKLRTGGNRIKVFYSSIIINKFLDGKLGFTDAQEILTKTNERYKKLEKNQQLENIKFDKDLYQKILADFAYAGQTGWNLIGGELVNGFEASKITDNLAIEADRLRSVKDFIIVILDNLQRDLKMIAAYPQEKNLFNELTNLENQFKSIDINTYPFFFKLRKSPIVSENPAYIKDGSLKKLLNLREKIGTLSHNNLIVIYYSSLIINKFLDNKLSFNEAETVLNEVYGHPEKEDDILRKILKDFAYFGSTGWDLLNGELVYEFNDNDARDINSWVNDIRVKAQMIFEHPGTNPEIVKEFEAIDIDTYPFFFKRNK